MAEAPVVDRARGTFERDTLPGDDYRAALVALFGAHALPVWGYGQRAVYEAYAMEGPSLDHWVRTTGLWAEAERDLWEWETMVAAVTDEPVDAVVTDVVGDLAAETIAAIDGWLDMVLLPACLDGVGEELVRTCSASTYGPLERHARRMVMYKRGQCAEGCSSLREIVRERQFDRSTVDAAAAKWLGIARRHAERVAEVEPVRGWVPFGIADPLDVDGALDRVEARLRVHLEDR
jgi:hypothetical protein